MTLVFAFVPPIAEGEKFEVAYLEFNFLLMLNHHVTSVRRVSQYLQGGYPGNESRLSMAVCTVRKRHIGHKLK